MQLLEHQAKELLSAAGISTPSGTLVQVGEPVSPTVDFPVVVKSQVPVGGRGKAGGIRVVHDPTALMAAYDEVKSLPIKGHLPESILLENALDIEREMYLALRINRDLRRIEWLVSSQGGIDIEDNAASVKIISQAENNDAYETIRDSLSLQHSTIDTLLKNLEICFIETDCLLLEINPLVLTKTHELIAADAKIVLDDNALFRHDAFANQAVSPGIIALGGTIGVIANGAGMAMSTMDTIYAAGGRPANFLDIGGGTGEDVFIRNLREITHLPGVTSIIINIFAGITRCDDIARGIIAAKREIDDLVPLYIRLEGTNRQEAAELLKHAQIEILPNLRMCVEKALESERKTQDSPTAPVAAVDDVSRVALVNPKTSGETPRRSEDQLEGQTNGSLTTPQGDETEILRRETNRDTKTLATAPGPLFTNHPVIIQGITGHHGAFHTRSMREAGTNIVAGVTPGKGGETVHDVPVYNTMAEAVSAHQADTSVVFVPARFAKDAICEAADAGIRLIVVITEHIPVHDMLAAYQYAAAKNTTIIGPNGPGLTVPGVHKLGIIATSITTPGSTTIISRSGTLTYELAYALTQKGIGQRLVLGIGGDAIQGTTFSEALALAQADPGTERIILVGEIGGTSEQSAADYAAHYVTKPIYGLVVGHSLPAGQQFGHAGAIVGRHSESAREKTDYMSAKGIEMFGTLDELIVAL